MSPECKNEDCDVNTNDADGLCRLCKFANKYKLPPREEDKEVGGAIPELSSVIQPGREEQNMPNFGTVVEEKTCIDCKKVYEPTSNVQKRCGLCGKEHIKIKNQARYKKRPIATTPIVDNAGQYHITVDFTHFPQLHEKLLVLAKEQIRKPEGQLLFLIQEEFRKMEQSV